ncbi:Chromosome II, complete genome, related [Eimeria brunetti]|uniref:Chromosome II, complete genome, related n=1 Tax=Eimeria brunetti TaxID=51314 RepID=U6LFB9_9EIME|nr:Chromosome II, complete genome, related [Eimeria brunetti]
MIIGAPLPAVRAARVTAAAAAAAAASRAAAAAGAGSCRLTSLFSPSIIGAARGGPWMAGMRACAISSSSSSSSGIIACAAASRRMFATESFPKGLEKDLNDTTNIPVGGENLYRRVGGPGYPMLFDFKYDRPTWQPLWEDEHEEIPRDGFGVPAHIPPEVSTKIKHVLYVPPQFFPFLKRLGDDTAELEPYMIKLIKGQMTFADYEEMFYKFAKPAKIYRRQIPAPYRTKEEMQKQQEVAWEGAWLSYRQRVLAGN